MNSNFRLLVELSTIIALLVGFHFYIDGRITKTVTSDKRVEQHINSQIDGKINDAKYMSKVSKILRPYLLFDEQGVTTYDHGALDYIKDIDIQGSRYQTITIETKEYLQFAPLIFFIGSTSYSYKPERINNHTWSYSLIPPTELTFAKNVEAESIYVLEVLL